ICANRNRVLVRSSRAFMVPPLALHTFGIKAIYRKYCHGESELPRDGFKPDRDLGGRSRPVTAVPGGTITRRHSRLIGTAAERVARPLTRYQPFSMTHSRPPGA